MPSLGQPPSFGFQVWTGGRPGKPLPHSHPDLEANLISGGAIAYLHGGRRIRLEPGRLHLFWAGIPHVVVERSETVEMAWITLPLTTALSWSLPSAFLRALLSGEVLSDADRPSVEAVELERLRLRAWESDLSAGDDVLGGIVLEEVAARIRRLARTWSPNRSIERPDRDCPESLRRALALASEEYHAIESVEEIARQVGLHPKYLIARFPQTFGIGLWDYVHRMRIGHAQRLLVMSDRTVGEIAFECGFSTLSAFYRAFGRISGGMTPKQFRG